MVNRVLRDDPSKSNMHNREGLSVKQIWKILKDWRMWPIYILGIVFMSTFCLVTMSAIVYSHFCCAVPVRPPQTYLTLSVSVVIEAFFLYVEEIR